MTISPRERRFLAWLGVSAILTLIIHFWPAASTPVVAPATNSIESAEKRLARQRELAATVPQKEEILKTVSAELAQREKGLIQAPTAAQARAQLLQILEKLCAAESIRIVSNELGGISPIGDDYGAVDVAVQIQCTIDQLVNLLAAIAAQPELIYTNGLRVTSTNNPKEKIVGVRVAVAAVVPRKLVPEKKGAAGL